MGSRQDHSGLAIGGPPSLRAARALLQGANLPAGDLESLPLEDFFYAGAADAPVGLVGLERFGPDALLRSLVVLPEHQGKGLGAALVRHAESYAAAHGVRFLYLLTTTAEAFFSRRGYALADRTHAPLGIQSTAEFSSLCPSEAVFMVKRLP